MKLYTLTSLSFRWASGCIFVMDARTPQEKLRKLVLHHSISPVFIHYFGPILKETPRDLGAMYWLGPILIVPG